MLLTRWRWSGRSFCTLIDRRIFKHEKGKGEEEDLICLMLPLPGQDNQALSPLLTLTHLEGEERSLWPPRTCAEEKEGRDYHQTFRSGPADVGTGLLHIKAICFTFLSFVRATTSVSMRGLFSFFPSALPWD